MCGVIGLVFEQDHPGMGPLCAELLRALEYRGYDSTGAAVMTAAGEVTLRKGVGGPSAVCEPLGITKLEGRIFCGQVRWATFGAVDDANAQPHVVECRAPVFGAHNGNVTNCDELQVWLQAEGHAVLSDNDGEMVVHSIEHGFAAALDALPAAERAEPAVRREVMRAAIVAAAERIKGSFAAVMVDRPSQGVWAIKAGSSLYAGVGVDPKGGAFAIASSDLSCVLKMTDQLVGLQRGEFAELVPGGVAVYGLADGAPRERPVATSSLRASDVSLRPPFRTFMEQEIADQPAALAEVIERFERGSDAAFTAAVEDFVARCAAAHAQGRAVHAVCCGSSYHAARAGALFFAEMARVPLSVHVPGEFRGQVLPCLRAGDAVVVVTQSGETKDLVDALTDVRNTGLDVARLALVNNLNSTIAQEHADVVVPLLCGPEIAVAATKSFTSQLAVFYGLALALGRRRLEAGEGDEALAAAVAARAALFARLPELVTRTLRDTEGPIDEAAAALCLAPSAHILGTRIAPVALEGALKVREVVINHTQGYEAAEFKHGPNTILGRNTLFGPAEVARFAAAVDPGSLGRVFREPIGDALDALESDYPLIYVTGPDPRDVALTVSQVNTHKIRGSSSLAIAEEHPALRGAITKAPSGRDDYRAGYVALPPSGDTLGVVFTATVALQRLALRMSELKAAALDAAGFRDHGVHPDVPKNVSKSITVD